ncbi:two-component sensor histidine kinase [Kaistia sp. 32K]|uniref:ATP-binding protein n=1 Tax=Kaistia sp. 32K TaxID=2795690 RepID=UPI001915703C|nr:ATP-binding protein [Kaistia sp. 32K]BCP51453.1 two-component sensor histidine kinase [Kaistia sp. 32K]
MNSLRRRLFLILLLATGVIWLSAVVWIYQVSRVEVEHVLDTRLQEAARMVDSLVSGRLPAPGEPAATLPGDSYARQLSCQIWSLDGRLIARSSGAPDEQLAGPAPGFSERIIDGVRWRIFTVDDAAKGVRVMVGDRLSLRDRLIADLIKGLLWPTLLVAPLLGLLIWISLGRGLSPLRDITRALEGRDAEDMRPIDASHAPAEIRPLADALNALFAKVEAARQQEREVTAFAAHELKTPLAGLKTQTQIALATTDDEIRNGALRQILSSVDRTTRLVRQLLVLARLDAGSSTPPASPISLGDIIDEIRAIGGPAPGCRVVVDPLLYDRRVPSDREMLTIALRNLHENAVQHSPPGGTVTWGFTPDGLGVMVEDEGPGIDADELPHVRQRFYRGRSRSPVGSGLGLAIVEAAAARIGWSLHLGGRTGRSGLRAELRRAGDAELRRAADAAA